jgi:hypothetical protein
LTRQDHLDGMCLPIEKAQAVLAMLLEGASVSSVERLSGVHHTTILKLLLLAGEKCERTLLRLRQWSWGLSARRHTYILSRKRAPHRKRRTRRSTGRNARLRYWGSAFIWSEVYRSFLRKLAYSALASLYMGNSGSAFFQSVRNSSYDLRAASASRVRT